jgi:hypothetical protein
MMSSSTNRFPIQRKARMTWALRGFFVDASSRKAGQAPAAIATLHAGLDHSLGWKSGIALFMNLSKSGTVKATSL